LASKNGSHQYPFNFSDYSHKERFSFQYFKLLDFGLTDGGVCLNSWLCNGKTPATFAAGAIP